MDLSDLFFSMGACTRTCVYVHCVYGFIWKPERQPQVSSQKCHPLPLRQGFSLSQRSPLGQTGMTVSSGTILSPAPPYLHFYRVLRSSSGPHAGEANTSPTLPSGPLCLIFEKIPHVSGAGLKFTIQPMVSLNFVPLIPDAWITGMQHHTQLMRC